MLLVLLCSTIYLTAFTMSSSDNILLLSTFFPSNHGVETLPGLIVAALTPVPFNYFRRHQIIACTACFDAL
jgi:hypothetical protein